MELGVDVALQKPRLTVMYTGLPDVTDMLGAGSIFRKLHSVLQDLNEGLRQCKLECERFEVHEVCDTSDIEISDESSDSGDEKASNEEDASGVAVASQQERAHVEMDSQAHAGENKQD
jgi:hypothetical protein